MLVGTFHWHFAKKLKPLWREARLLCFSNGGDPNTDDNDEVSPESAEASSPEVPSEAQTNITSLTEKYSGRLDKVGALVAKATVESPLALGTALDELENQLHDDKENPLNTLVEKGRAYIKTVEDGQEAGGAKEELLADVTAQLNNPLLAHAVTVGFDTTATKADELIGQVGDTSITRLTEIETELGLDGGKKIDAESMSTDDIDRIVAELGIDPAINLGEDDESLDGESFKALRKLREHMQVSEQDMAGGQATNTLKVRLIQKKIIAAKKLAVIEKKSFGSESTLEGTDTLKQTIIKQATHARRHLERVVRIRAAELKDAWDNYCRELVQQSGNDGTNAIAEYLGESPLVIDQRSNEIEATLQQALRKGLVKVDGQEDAQDPKNLARISDPHFTRGAQTTLQKLDNLDWLLSKDDATRKRGLIGPESTERTEAREWITANAERLAETATSLFNDPDKLSDVATLISGPNPMPEDVVEQQEGVKLVGEIAGRIRSGNATSQDWARLDEYMSAEATRDGWDKLSLALTSPSYMMQIKRDKRLIGADTATSSAETVSQSTQALEAVAHQIFENTTDGSLKHAALTHHVCDKLPVKTELFKLYKQTATTLQSLESQSGEGADAALRGCRLDIAKLQKTVTELDRLARDGDMRDRIQMFPPEQIERYKEKSGGSDTSVGCYNRADGTIYLNEQALSQVAASEGKSFAQLRDETIYHETGHAIVDLLMHRVGVLPGLMIAFDKVLKENIPGEHNRMFEDLLWEREEAWGISHQRRLIFKHEKERIERQDPGTTPESVNELADERTDAKIREFLMDELANKYASWKNEGMKNEGYSKEDLALFGALEGNPDKLKDVAFNEDEIAQYDRPNDAMPDVALQSEHDAGDDDLMPPGGGEGGGEESEEGEFEGAQLSDRIINAQNDFLVLKDFIENHRNVDGVDAYESWVNEWENTFKDRILNPYYSPIGSGRPSDSQLADLMDILETSFLGPAKAQKGDVTKADMEANQSGGGLGIWGYVKSIELASMNDVIGMFKSMGEDLQRMWKRRGERVQSLMGHNLTSWIPDNNIIGARYAGQLKHEFERRNNASELEEVKQWKDAYENVDSFALMDQLAASRNKDEVRAIVEILTERGRLDWNDEGFWKTLKSLSGLPMPIGACRGDSRVRDQWLQRMITAVWNNDKDKFFDWRQANDNGVESGKKKFTQVADQLSNMAGGLAGALQRQLSLWVDAKNSGSPVPEDVNPHLYEEILHYAMRNGKMTMEGKLFYLIQGIRHGLLTVDRLQALNGEHGGILNSFPVIDYFMFRHNTLPEIEALGKRIDEGDGKFAPGSKTTLWLHLEVLRDEFAKMRISKATSGTRAETLDHEDIPTVMAYADYRTVERLLDVVSGSREKMSPEAVKNAYTGFGTKFKVLSQLAELDMLTQTDVQELAKGIAAYIHYDNIVTRNGEFKEGFTKMSWGEFRTTSPSSNDLAVKDFRDANTGFVSELLDTVGDQIDWNKINNVAEGIDQSNIMRRGGDEDSSHENDPKRKNMRKGMEAFSREIERVITTNPSAIINVLRSNRNKLHEEGAATKSTADADQHINASGLRQYMRDRADHGIALGA